MPESMPLAKAELRQLDASFENLIEPSTWTTVQFNPESLKVSLANQVTRAEGAGDQSGNPAYQFVGTGSTRLSLQLWFDASAPQEGAPAVSDVRELTRKVAFFMTPRNKNGVAVPPAVRFLWGSFQFDGVMESLEESLEFFSPDGRPLRASVSFSLTQGITLTEPRPTSGAIAGAPGAPGGMAAGTARMLQAPMGATLQGLAARQGLEARWQDIASANGIENPRRLAPGQLINLPAGIRGSRR